MSRSSPEAAAGSAAPLRRSWAVAAGSWSPSTHSSPSTAPSSCRARRTPPLVSIIAAGGSAQASSASVTDGDALRALFQDLADQHGGVDAVVNVAGITRQSYFAQGSEEDWLALLSVHLGGYLNVLEAALPLMAAAGHGRILGVTSGSGWRAADAGGYSCAKRAVAALTWRLGAMTPPGVTVNAISPIANTRMVAAALERARRAGRAGGGGGLTLTSMPGPEDLGPLGAHLVSDEFGWCSGQVLFAGGSEIAVVDQPRLVEVVRTDEVASLRGVLHSVLPRAFASAESTQTTDGGSNPRFGPIFGEPGAPAAPPGDANSCALVTDRTANGGLPRRRARGTLHRMPSGRRRARIRWRCRRSRPRRRRGRTG